MKAKSKTKNAAAAAGVSGIRVPEQDLVAIADVNMAAYNPRVMPRQQMDALKASLRKHGMVLNLVVQREGMVLIGGHQRVRAMRELCAEHGWAEPGRIPATILDVGDAEARQLNVSLNNIEGEFDPYKLGEMFKGIFGDMTSDDVLATGFAPEEIRQAIELVIPPGEEAVVLENEAGDIVDFAKSITLSIEFDTVEDRDAAKTALRELATREKRRAGMVVGEAVRAYAAVRGRKANGKAGAASKHA